MSRRPSDHSTGQLYPRRYFDASPTWFVWNKLRAADIHDERKLRQVRGFEGQRIYFWLNHPMQYVDVVGFVADVFTKFNTPYTFLHLDDGSGALIEVKITTRDTPERDEALYPSNTLLSNVDVAVSFGVPAVSVDKRPAVIGAVMRVKGQLDQFRGTRQIVPKRVSLVKDTGEEAAHWKKAADLKCTVLSRPWVLSDSEQIAIDAKIKKQEQADTRRARDRQKRGAKDVEEKRERMERHEQKKLKRHEKMNDGALHGSDVLPRPWA